MLLHDAGKPPSSNRPTAGCGCSYLYTTHTSLTHFSTLNGTGLAPVPFILHDQEVQRNTSESRPSANPIDQIVQHFTIFPGRENNE
jgi:hypothetical protein